MDKNSIRSVWKINYGGGDTSTQINLSKRIKLIKQYVGNIDGKRVVDCGCGTGQYVLALISLGADAWGFDYEYNKIIEYKKQRGNPSRVFVSDVQKTGLKENSFNIAILNEVLEHVPDDSKALAEIFRILKPGGYVIIFSPNRFYPFETHGVISKISNRRVPHYYPFIPYIPIRLGSIFMNYWARNYWPSELRTMVTKSGFLILHTNYVWQTFENISRAQPKFLGKIAPTLRRISSTLEKIPIVRTIGVSQVIFGVKPVN